MSGKSSYASDFWSISIIIYLLFSGQHPFLKYFGSNIFDVITYGSLDFTGMPRLSDEAKYFLHGVLQQNPVNRMSAEEALGTTPPPRGVQHTK